MKLTFATDPASDALKLTGDLDIYQLDALKNALAESMLQQTDLTLDLSGVETCDFTGLQLLHAAALTLTRRGAQLRFVSPSARFRASLLHLGFPATTIQP